MKGPTKEQRAGSGQHTTSLPNQGLEFFSVLNIVRRHVAAEKAKKVAADLAVAVMT